MRGERNDAIFYVLWYFGLLFSTAVSIVERQEEREIRRQQVNKQWIRVTPQFVEPTSCE
jgi:hypothetical protein